MEIKTTVQSSVISARSKKYVLDYDELLVAVKAYVVANDTDLPAHDSDRILVSKDIKLILELTYEIT